MSFHAAVDGRCAVVVGRGEGAHGAVSACHCEMKGPLAYAEAEGCARHLEYAFLLLELNAEDHLEQAKDADCCSCHLF